MAEHAAAAALLALRVSALGGLLGLGPEFVVPAPASAQSTGVLQLVAVDTSRFPVVTIDLAVPDRESGVTLGAGAFRVDGAEVISAARLDPRDLGVGLVFDDGTGVPAQAIIAQQGAAVEVARNVDAGTELAVAATSGVAAGPSADRAAVIRAIASVGSKRAGGSGELVEALGEAVSALVRAGSRRQVLALVADASLEGADITSLREVLRRSHVMLHAVSTGTRLDPGFKTLAAATGGIAWSPGPRGFLAAVDALTGSLTGQYRLEVRLTEPGRHIVELSVESRRYQTEVEVDPAGASTSSMPAPSVTALTGSAAVVSSSVAPRASSAGDESSEEQRRIFVPIIAAGLVALALLSTALLLRRRHRRHPPEVTLAPAPPPAWLAAEAAAVLPPVDERWDDETWEDEDWDDLDQPEPAGRTLGDWFETWWPTVTNLRSDVAERDEGYAREYMLPILGPIALDRLDQPTLVDWVTDLGDPEVEALNPPTVHRVVQILRRCLGAAVDEGLLTDNPAAKLPLPEIEQDAMRILTEDEIWRLAHATHPRYRTAVLLAGFCGLRLGELLALRWDQVDLAERRLRVAETMTEDDGRLQIGPPKTKAAVRSLPLPDFVVESLAPVQDGANGNALVFGLADGRPLHPGVFRRRFWIPAVDKAGLAPLWVRDLRNSAVAIWIAERMHPEQIVTLAGMTSVSVLFRLYGHLYLEPDELMSALDERSQLSGDGAGAPAETASNVHRD